MSHQPTHTSGLSSSRTDLIPLIISYLQLEQPHSNLITNAFFEHGSATKNKLVTDVAINLSASYCRPCPLSEAFSELTALGNAILTTTETKLLKRLEQLLSAPRDTKQFMSGSIYNIPGNRAVVASLLKEFTNTPLQDGVILAQQIPALFKTYWERMTDHEKCPMPLLKVISSQAPLETRIFISVLSQVFQSQKKNPFFAISQLTTEEVGKVSAIVKKFESLIQETAFAETPFHEINLTCQNIALTPDRSSSANRHDFFKAIALAPSILGPLSNYFHQSTNPEMKSIGQNLSIGKSFASMAFDLCKENVGILTLTEAAMLSVLQSQAEPQKTELTYELLSFFKDNHRSQFETLKDVACYCRKLAEIKIDPQQHRELYRAIRKELSPELRASVLMLQFCWEKNGKSAFMELAKLDLEKLPKIQDLTRNLQQEVQSVFL